MQRTAPAESLGFCALLLHRSRCSLRVVNLCTAAPAASQYQEVMVLPWLAAGAMADSAILTLKGAAPSACLN